jgi:hypothetical protein
MSNEFFIGMIVGSVITVLPPLIHFVIKHVRIV